MIIPSPCGTMRAGTMLWHVYPPIYASTAFNANADSRFSLRPERAMYYTGATASAALWETVLRNLVPTRGSRKVDVPVDSRSIAQVTVAHDVPVLELIAPRLNEIAEGEAFREAVHVATIQSNYAATHAIARELLARYPDAAGLSWHSRQATKEVVTVFYAPPGTADWFTQVNSIALASLQGLALIDAALAEYDLTRLDPAGLSSSAMPPAGIW